MRPHFERNFIFLKFHLLLWSAFGIVAPVSRCVVPVVVVVVAAVPIVDRSTVNEALVSVGGDDRHFGAVYAKKEAQA